MNIKGDEHTLGLGRPPWVPGAELDEELSRVPYAALLEALPVGVLAFTTQATPLYCNAAARDILGRELSWEERPEALVQEYQAYRIDTDRLYPIEELPIVRALRGEPCSVEDMELRFKQPPVVLHVSATPVRDRAGNVRLALACFTPAPAGRSPACQPGAARDLDRELRQASKLTALGELAAGVAHEINTPMQYIGDNTAFLEVTIKRLLDLAGSFERLLVHCKAGTPPRDAVLSCERELQRGRIAFMREQAPSAIEQTLAGIDQVRSIIQALKEFSHPGDEQRVSVDMNHLVKMAITVTRNAWRYHADLVLELTEELPLVLGYPQELGQVLINLIVNAAHAIEEKSAAEGHANPGRIVIRSAVDGDQVSVEIEDNGRGIPESIRDRIMTPFFTTKPAGKGTGQGLALARSVIVDRHGGSLSFSTTCGSGTVFHIHLTGQEDG